MTLQFKELLIGDILLQHHSGSFSGAIIKFGQQLLSHNRSGGHGDLTHATMFGGSIGGKQIIYASESPTLVAVDITGAGYRYEVYRYNDRQLAELAAWIAEGYVAETSGRKAANPKSHYGSYSVMSALGCVFHSSTRGAGAKQAEKGLWGSSAKTPSNSFYCSNFATRAYLAAGQASGKNVVPIDADYRYISVKELQARLNKDSRWKHCGQLIT
jgi:hypothetical protein